MIFEMIEDTQAVFYASDDFPSVYAHHPFRMTRDASSFSSPSYNTFHPHSSCDLPLVNFSWISPLGTASTETSYGREIVDDSDSDIESYLDCFYDSVCNVPADSLEDDAWDYAEPCQNPIFVPSTPLSGKAELDFDDLDDRPRRISVIVLNEEIRSPSYESLPQEDGVPRSPSPSSRRPSRESILSVKVFSPECEDDVDQVFLPVIGSPEAVAVIEPSLDLPAPIPRPTPLSGSSSSNDVAPTRQVSIFLPAGTPVPTHSSENGGIHVRAHPLRRLSRVIHAKAPQPTSSKMRQTVFLMVEVDPPPTCPTAPPSHATRTEVVYEPRAGGLKSLLNRIFKKRRAA
jgi:hypothetical protein